MDKKKYTKPLLEVEEMKLQSIIALSFGDGTTNTMESKLFYFEYEEEEEEDIE
jgi:hypothetical protein